MTAYAPAPPQQLSDALTAGDLEAVEAIVVEHLFELFAVDWSLLVSAVQRLPAEAVARHAELQVMVGFFARVPLADTAINREVTPAVRSEELPAGQTPDRIRHWVMLQELLAYRFRGEFDQATEVGARLREEVRGPDAQGRRPMHELVALVLLHVGIAETLAGRLDRALEDFDEARRLRMPGRPDVAGRDIIAKTALIQASNGDLKASEAALRRAERMASPSASFQHFYEMTRAMIQALIAVERLDPAAEELIAVALDIGSEDELWVFAFIAATRWAIASGDFTYVLDAVHRARRLKAPQPGSFLDVAITTTQARSLLLLGESEAAARVLDEAGRGPRAEHWAMAPVRVRLALQVEGPEAALELARAAMMTPGFGPVARAETMLLMAWAQLRLHGAADPTTTRPLGRLIAREGLWRMLQLVPPEVAAAVPGAIPAAGASAAPGPSDAPAVSAAAATVDGGQGDGPQSGPELRLTKAELEVLRLLAGPESLPAIARARFVTLNTVKTQVASLYRRMGVHARREAVAEARRRGLLR